MGRCGEFDENSLKRNTGILKTGIPIYNQYIYIPLYTNTPKWFAKSVCGRGGCQRDIISSCFYGTFFWVPRVEHTCLLRIIVSGPYSKSEINAFRYRGICKTIQSMEWFSMV